MHAVQQCVRAVEHVGLHPQQLGLHCHMLMVSKRGSWLQIWHYDEAKRQWAQQGDPLKGHTDWVRDVAWAPNLGMPMTTIASAGQDGKVLIWTEQNNQWSKLVRQLPVTALILDHAANFL